MHLARLHADAPEFNPNQPAWAPRAADKVFGLGPNSWDHFSVDPGFVFPD